MAITPAQPTFKDVTSRGRVYVWVAPTIAVNTDTIVTSFKRVFAVTVGSRPTLTWSSSAGAVGGTLVVTVGCSASCTGGNTPLMIYGQ